MKVKRVMVYVTMLIAILAIAGGCHRRFGHEQFPEKFLEHVDDHVEDLNLSGTQTVKYQELRVRLAEDLQKMKADHKAFRDQFKETVNNDKSELGDVTNLVREKSKAIPAMVSIHLDYLEEFYAILDQTQQEELKAEFRKKMNRHWD